MNPSKSVSVGQRVRFARVHSRMTRAALARDAEMSPERLREIERSGANIPFLELCRIAAAMGVSLDYLTSGRINGAHPELESGFSELHEDSVNVKSLHRCEVYLSGNVTPAGTRRAFEARRVRRPSPAANAIFLSIPRFL